METSDITTIAGLSNWRQVSAAHRTPVFGGTLKRYDFNAIKNRPGIKAAVEIPNGVAVVADSFWRAKTAMEAIPVEWDFGAHATANSAAFRQVFHTALDQEGVVAKAVGKSVKLLWAREEDMRHGFYRPISALRFRAGLDAKGVPTAFFNRSVTHSILAWFRPDDVKSGIDRTSVEGLANMPYDFANYRIEHLIRNTHVPVAFWRSVGSSQNAFALESFIDELAHAGGKDPAILRRELLRHHKDWLHVLDTVLQKASWGKPLPKGSAQGLAIHDSFGSIVAQVAEVSLSQAGALRVDRVVSAIDCGHVVNPLTVAEQMESSVVYGLTAALYGQITITDGRVVEGNFDTYPMLRLNAMPEVETHLALTGGTKWGGVGEPGVPPVAPAVCNAIFKITGKRIRSLPLRHHDLRWT